jgi:hypothetical protein
MGRWLKGRKKENMNLLKVLLLLCLSILLSRSSAQQTQSTEPVLYLKNGWILRGSKITDTDSTYILTTKDGSRYVFPKTEADSTKWESPWNSSIPSGFGHFTEIGALAATKNRPDNVTTAAFSFQTVNGYHLSPRFFGGLGVGIDLYATETFVPLFASIRGNILRESAFMPFYFIDAGYGFNITNSTAVLNYTGGLMLATGIGFKRAFNERNGFFISGGYRLQNSGIVTEGIKQRLSNNRIALRAGFYF